MHITHNFWLRHINILSLKEKILEKFQKRFCKMLKKRQFENDDHDDFDDLDDLVVIEVTEVIGVIVLDLPM